MTLYISGKISDLDPELTRKKFFYFEQELKAVGIEVINPMALPHPAGNWEEYLAHDLKLLVEKCDGIFAIYDSDDSKGARLEMAFCREIGRPVYRTLSEVRAAQAPLTERRDYSSLAPVGVRVIQPTPKGV